MLEEYIKTFEELYGKFLQLHGMAIVNNFEKSIFIEKLPELKRLRDRLLELFDDDEVKEFLTEEDWSDFSDIFVGMDILEKTLEM
jgi:hypothetical protein